MRTLVSRVHRGRWDIDSDSDSTPSSSFFEDMEWYTDEDSGDSNPDGNRSQSQISEIRDEPVAEGSTETARSHEVSNGTGEVFARSSSER